MFPIIVIRRTRFRPYLSDSAPILGDTKNCRVLIYLERCHEYRGEKLTRRQNPLVRLRCSINSSSTKNAHDHAHPGVLRPISVNVNSRCTEIL